MGGNPFVSFNFNFNFIFLLVFVLVLFQFLITIRGRRVLNQHRSTTGRCRSTLHHEHRSPLHCVDWHSYQTAGMTWFSLLNFYSFYLFTSSDWITLETMFFKPGGGSYWHFILFWVSVESFYIVQNGWWTFSWNKPPNHSIAQFLDLLTRWCTEWKSQSASPANNIHTCWECLKEPKLTSNLINSNCLSWAWNTLDRIPLACLEGKSLCVSGSPLSHVQHLERGGKNIDMSGR